VFKCSVEDGFEGFIFPLIISLNDQSVKPVFHTLKPSFHTTGDFSLIPHSRFTVQSAAKRAKPKTLNRVGSHKTIFFYENKN
jgi:hypothetical protein